MNGLNNIGTSNSEEVVIPLKRLGVISEFGAAIIILLQTIALNHGTHSTIQHQDPLFKEIRKQFVHQNLFLK
jgi:hypothetical protein